MEKASLERRPPSPLLQWERHITTSSSNRTQAVAWAGKPVMHHRLSGKRQRSLYMTDPRSLFQAIYCSVNIKAEFSFQIGFIY